MAKRYGRNQRRQAREEIARLTSKALYHQRREVDVLRNAAMKIASLERRLHNAIEFRVSVTMEPIDMTHRARLDVVKGEAIVSADVAWSHDQLRDWVRYGRSDEMRNRVAAALTDKMLRGER